MTRPSLPEAGSGPLAKRTLTVLGALAGAGLLIGGLLVLLPARPPERIAYFADWNVAGRGFTVADLERSGAPERLTRLIWAFGDVGEDGLCRVPAHDPYQAWELYQRRYAAGESVDGEADTYGQELAGSLNQLRKLRERYPDLDVSLSLGGWNLSAHFSTAARTPESRRAFVESCLDLWIRGDLPVAGGEPQGGDGAGAGLFDGIDIDWEWPGGQGRPGNTVHPDDPGNFTLLVAEFRRRFDALEEETGRRYTLSVSLPGGTDTGAAYEGRVFDLVDFATVQGYDFSGPWSERTAHHSNLHAPAYAPGSASVDRAVRHYLDLGAPPGKLVVGVPAFGRGWQGVDGGGDGRDQVASGPADHAYDGPTMAFSDLEDLAGERFLDEDAGAAWVYDGDRWWTYDTPEVIALKGAYVLRNDLGGLMVWNLDMDPDGVLIRAVDESLR